MVNEGEQGMPPVLEVVTSEEDVYGEHSELGQWLNDIKPGEPKYKALKNIALYEELTARVNGQSKIGYREGGRFEDTAVAALGALEIRINDDRDEPGYTTAERALNGIIERNLINHHAREVRGKDGWKVSQYAHSEVGIRLKKIRDNIVNPKPQPTPPVVSS